MLFCVTNKIEAGQPTYNMYLAAFIIFVAHKKIVLVVKYTMHLFLIKLKTFI